MTRDALAARIAALIDRLADGRRDDAARDELLREVLRHQRRVVPAFSRLVERLGDGQDDPLLWPALPTDTFRFARVAAHAPELDLRVFRTSGTTSGARGSHALRDLSLYDRAARAAGGTALFPDGPLPLVVLAPVARELPDSSLSYMLERFGDWFGRGEVVHVITGDALDADLLERTLRAHERAAQAVALLGTSFAFVHADDAFGARRFQLPPGSRIMQTGGFKGRSRSVQPDAMLALLHARYGVPPAFIVQEYGMTELCSQSYESTLREALLGQPLSPRRLLAPGWVRVTAVDPETLVEVEQGRTGILRIDDLANLDSCCAIQTSDLGRAVLDGFVVMGRAPGATPRGCSLAIDAALGGRP